MREVDRGRPGAQVSGAGGAAWDGGVPASRALTPVLVFVALMSTVIASLGAPLLPVIMRHYHVSLAASQWGLTITLLAGAVTTPVLGRLGDGRHRRTAILAVMALTAVGCAVAALPFGFGVLLVGRALQGGALGLVPLVTAVAREHLAGVLLVRLVLTPHASGYGFGATIVFAGLMLTPYSLASLLGSRVAVRAAGRAAPELVVVASSLVLVAAMTLFAVDRHGYLPLVIASALTGFGVGCAWAVNPLQIASGVPPSETGSAMSFYMLTRMIGYSLGSTLSATVLAAHQASGAPWPSGSAYADAAWICVALLVAAFLAAVTFARRPGTAPPPGGPAQAPRAVL